MLEFERGGDVLLGVFAVAAVVFVVLLPLEFVVTLLLELEVGRGVPLDKLPNEL